MSELAFERQLNSDGTKNANYVDLLEAIERFSFLKGVQHVTG